MERVGWATALVAALGLLGLFNWAHRDLWTAGPANVPAEGARRLPEERIFVPGSKADCGPMSLFVLGKLAGKDPDIAGLRRTVKSAEGVTTMLDLRNGATELGFDVEAQQLNYGQLHRRLSEPGTYAILHFESDHFAPAVGVSGERIRMLDAAIGVEDVDEGGLGRRPYGWDGKALILTARTPHQEPRGIGESRPWRDRRFCAWC